jgi:hypothetical protein
MRKLAFVVMATVLAGTACSGMGQRDPSSAHHGSEMTSGKMKPGHHRGMGKMMQRMDANGDGMLSKEEFMAAHEAMFDRMKGPDGMISLKDMQMRGHHQRNRNHEMK